MDGIGFLLVAVFFSGILIGFLAGKFDYRTELSSCAKLHNVYECQLIAVPKR